MCCKNLWLKIITFFFAFGLGVAISNVLPTANFSTNQMQIIPAEVAESMRVISKERANYTSNARENQTEGTVTLRVTFLASGQIGSISVVNGLPDGLTEQAIMAAKQIKFEPAKTNGVPKTVTKLVQYTFTIY